MADGILTQVKLPNNKLYDVKDTVSGYLTAPSSPTAGDAIIYNGSSWSKQNNYGYTKLTSNATICNDSYFFQYNESYGFILALDVTPNMTGIVSGYNYTVTYDGTTYTCTARTPQTGIITLGNLKFIQGTDTGEPFLYATKYTIGSTTYNSIWVASGSENTYHTIKVVGTANITNLIDSKYTGLSVINNKKGNFSANIGFNNNASGFACIANGSDNTASGYVSYAEGSHTTASEAYAHSLGYYTEANARYSSAAGYYSVASGALSNAEGERTTASGYCSRTFGRENTANGSYSIAEGRGNSTSTDFQHMFGQYGVTGSGARITGWGTSSTHKNIEKLDTSGNLRLAGNVYVGCANDSSGGYQVINSNNIGSQSVNYATSAGNADTLDGYHSSSFASSSHTHSYLPLSGGTLTGALQANKVIKAYRYTTTEEKALPAITLDKPGGYAVGIGADGTDNRIRFGPCDDMNGGAWKSISQFNSNEWYFQGAINTTNSFQTKRNLLIDEGLSTVPGNGSSTIVTFNITFTSQPRVVACVEGHATVTGTLSVDTSDWLNKQFTMAFIGGTSSVSRTVNWIAIGSTS